MRLIILSANGTRQHYLINQLAKHHEIAGVLVDDRYDTADRLGRLWRASSRNPLTFMNHVWLKARLIREETAEQEREEQAYRVNGVRPDLSGFDVQMSPNINDEASVAWVRGRKPEALVVFGTRLLKQPMMDVTPRRILNLHTGLSPYYRGGHCTFFCLYNEEPQFIGVTVHLIDPGIDSGNLVLTGRPTLNADDSVASIEAKLVLMGTDMMLEALNRLARDELRSVKQWMEGKLFYSRDFTLEKRIALKKQLGAGLLRKHLHSAATNDVRTIS